MELCANGSEHWHVKASSTRPNIQQSVQCSLHFLPSEFVPEHPDKNVVVVSVSNVIVPPSQFADIITLAAGVHTRTPVVQV